MQILFGKHREWVDLVGSRPSVAAQDVFHATTPVYVYQSSRLELFMAA